MFDWRQVMFTVINVTPRSSIQFIASRVYLLIILDFQQSLPRLIVQGWHLHSTSHSRVSNLVKP